MDLGLRLSAFIPVHAFAISQGYLPTVCISQARLGYATMTSVTQASVPHKEKGWFSPVFCGCCVFAVALFSHFIPEPRIFLSVSGGRLWE